MTTPNPLLTHSALGGYTSATPLPTQNGLGGYAGGSPAMGGVPGQPTPQRPGFPPPSSSQRAGYGHPGTPLQTAQALASSSSATPHQLALLQRNQQSSRPTPTGSPHLSSTSQSLVPVEDGPPHKYPVSRSFSRVRETDPGEPFPSIPAGEQSRVQSWIECDIAYEEELATAKQERVAVAQGLLEEMAREQDWLGPLEAQPRGKLRLRWPEQKVQEDLKGKRGSLRTPVPLSKKQLRAAASTSEHLVPIRIDLEHEVYKLRDTFIWNLRESTITPKQFASHLLADLRFPQEPFLKQMIASFEKQIADAQISLNYEGHVDSSISEAQSESRIWFEERASKRRRLGKEREHGELEVGDEELLEEGEEALPVQAVVPTGAIGASDELRVMIKLDITFDTMQLVDKFEWDIGNPYNSPEEFAETFAAELGLNGEFATAIAHAIREQVDIYTRSLCILGYAKGGSVTDDDLRREFLPALDQSFRTETADEFTPLLNQLTRDDVDRIEKEADRENRRKRRQTKGRGVVLPDREPTRTNRTIVPRSLPGLVSFEIDVKGNKTYHLPELNEPYPLVAKPLPPKPANLTTSDASPLKLLASKESTGVPRPLVGAAAAQHRKKQQADAHIPPGDSPVKSGVRKKPPVIKATVEEAGLHEHVVDGHWFCANCGVPDKIAVGRRKGPTGKDSLCGLCGKYYHRYKRQRPCTYTRDYDTHVQLRGDAETKAKSSKPKKPLEVLAAEDAALRQARNNGRATPASQAMSPASSAHEDDDSDFSTSSPPKNRRGKFYGSPDTPFINLDSDDSGDELSVAGGSPPPPPTLRRRPGTPPAVPTSQHSATHSQASATSSAPQPLPWMAAAAAELRAKQLDDRFEIIPRPRPVDATVQEWRIRCLDCPGKLYNLGPGETLDGFLVHFKNRAHRDNVGKRLAQEKEEQ